jgi:hypothetical protein
MANAATDDDGRPDRSGRLQSLREDVDALRIRKGSARTEQQVKVGGAVLIPVGLVLIALGWYGASDTIFVDEQIAYLISGGVLGLALVMTGGFLYLRYWLARQRYWLARMALDARRHSEEVVAALGRIETLLGGDGGRGEGGRDHRAPPTGAPHTAER